MVIVMLLCAMVIPRVVVGEYKTKRVNILSDIFKLEGDTTEVKSSELVLDTTFMASVPEVTRVKAHKPKKIVKKPKKVVVAKPKVVAPKVATPAKVKNIKPKKPVINLVQIEEYDTVVSSSSMDAFYGKIGGNNSTDIRVAFFGDSFIEGDLFTADVRELLQNKFSGRGVGFVPITSIVSQFRGSVKHTFSGWTCHTLLKPKAIPVELKDKFYVSGEIFEAKEGASVRYEGVRYRKHLKNFSLARFIFMNRGESTINVVVNDTILKSFTPSTSDEIQEIKLYGEIHSVEIKIENHEKFLGYGVVFEDEKGVVVDNYSLRGNSGLSLCGSNYLVNNQIDNSLKYDLIVLQYGLNVLTADVKNYAGYTRLMRRVVAHVKRSFPNSSILLMGVSDRSIKVEGKFVTMPTLKNMLEAQRSVAKSCGIAFWNTYEAMGGKNSMVDFVKRKWGAKDFTHFSHAGGTFLAKRFVASIFSESKKFVANGGSDTKEIYVYEDNINPTATIEYNIDSDTTTYSGGATKG